MKIILKNSLINQKKFIYENSKKRQKKKRQRDKIKLGVFYLDKKFSNFCFAYFIFWVVKPFSRYRNIAAAV